MRNLAFILVLALITSSCNLFKKSAMTQEEINALVAKNQSLEQQVNAQQDLQGQLSAANAQIQSLKTELAELQEACKGRFMVIVGAFKVPSNATDYSQTIKNAGYEGKIVPGPFGFDLVTYSTHESLPEALRALSDAQVKVIDTAWIYIKN
ncbi:MAG: hypothetical protein JXR52_04510 [Bacteroidales bacterium]|nr:hypothetical protein [Bacteroidales bacterium]